MPLINDDRLGRTIVRIGRYAANVEVIAAVLAAALLAFLLIFQR